MIKIFRHIRKSMIKENRTSKYLLYAVGEIILVVIGILIALSINTWNTTQKDIAKEQQILLSLQEEFRQNIEELKFDHQLNVGSRNALQTLLNFDKNVNFETKTIDSLIGQVYNYATFDARLGVINDLSSSGNLELISDSKLRYALNQWTGELDDYKEDIVIRREYWLSNAPPLMNKLIPVRNQDAYLNREDYARDFQINLIKVPKSNYVEFLTNLEIDGLLYDLYINQAFVTVNEESIMQFLESTLKIIEGNIEHD